MGFHGILHYGQKAHNNKWRIRERICKLIIKVYFQSDISLSAEIADNVHFCHSGFGTVVNPRAKIGGGTCIQHGVTIGDLFTDGSVPEIGQNCFVGARALILGNVHIGNNVNIGAGAVVLQDIPDNCTAVGVPAHIVYPKKI